MKEIGALTTTQREERGERNIEVRSRCGTRSKLSDVEGHGRQEREKKVVVLESYVERLYTQPR
jgi:hypothetical protein